MLQENVFTAHVHDGARCQGDAQPLPYGRLTRVPFQLPVSAAVNLQKRGHDVPPYGSSIVATILWHLYVGVK